MRINQDKIENIKQIQLKMLDEFNNFCRANNIKYSLAYGSMLGAIRHKGYIPWDDDIDIWMLREDFNKFNLLFKNENNVICDMYNTENYPFYMTKLINKRTELVEQGCSHVNFKYGVYIDIFILDYLPNNKLIREFKLAINYFYYGLLQLKYRKTENKLLIFVQNYIDIKKIYKKIEKLWSQKDGKYLKDDDTLYFLFKNASNRKYIFASELFRDCVDVEFEYLTCSIFSEYDKILKQCYGDYKILPPVENREVHNFIDFKEF